MPNHPGVSAADRRLPIDLYFVYYDCWAAKLHNKKLREEVCLGVLSTKYINSLFFYGWVFLLNWLI